MSHYENNYGGAVKRLNLIMEKLAETDFNSAPNFLISGLKREQLIATNSMVLHELFFDGLGKESAPEAGLMTAIVRDFGSYERWRSEFIAMGKAQGAKSYAGANSGVLIALGSSTQSLPACRQAHG